MVLGIQKLAEFRNNFFDEAVSFMALASYASSGDYGTKGLMPNLGRAGLMPSLSGRELETKRKSIFDISPLSEGQVGDAGFDFRLGECVVRTDYVDEHLRVRDLEKMEHVSLNDGESFVFEADKNGRNVYYVPSFEDILLSHDLEIEVHAKSTSGRVGCHVGGYFDRDSKKLIMVLQPVAFDLIGKCGKTQFGQGVIRYLGSGLPSREEILKRDLVRVSGRGDIEKRLTHKGLEMQFNTSYAYRAKRTRKPIDMEAKNLDWTKWWDFIEGNSDILLEARTLYLLGSLGGIQMRNACGVLSKEQRTFNGFGGFGCLAGIIQPGFSGQITMEPFFPTKTRIHRGDAAGVVMIDDVEGLIQGDYEGDYQGQKAPRLPKMFKEHKF